jgi:hypothetical protein
VLLLRQRQARFDKFITNWFWKIGHVVHQYEENKLDMKFEDYFDQQLPDEFFNLGKFWFIPSDKPPKLALDSTKRIYQRAIRPVFRKSIDLFTWFLCFAYYSTWVLLAIPLALGFFMDASLVAPISMALYASSNGGMIFETTPIIYLGKLWSVGLLCMELIYRLMRILEFERQVRGVQPLNLPVANPEEQAQNVQQDAIRLPAAGPPQPLPIQPVSIYMKKLYDLLNDLIRLRTPQQYFVEFHKKILFPILLMALMTVTLPMVRMSCYLSSLDVRLIL